ncbi:CDP-glycerol glycerophosphotransferase family protein [Brochothrix thermosphacta]|uniref:CDP-glycerol glycerophosphotransferase family protein n=1 Tax=Brochothrix thermosphacta TaxID=2756 RepID=UPI003F9E9358
MKKKITKYKNNKLRYKYAKLLNSNKIISNTVLLESTHGKSINGHIFYMMKDFCENHADYTIYVASKNPEEDRLFLESNNIYNVNVIEHMSSKYFELLANVEILINDTTFFPFFNKKEGQKYYIIWHGTPLKYMGKDMQIVTDVANVQRNFYMADKIIVSNDYTKDVLVKTHNLENVYPGEIVVAPSPRNDILFDDVNKKVLRGKAGLDGKKIVFYMPTWRGNVNSVKHDSQKVEEDLQVINDSIDSNVMFYVKLHPFQNNIDLERFENINFPPENIELYEFLSITDVLITDYSSVMYDFMNTGKEIVLYTYDKEEYAESRGMYEEIENYPFKKIEFIEELVDSINATETKNSYEKLHSHFCMQDNLNGTNELIEYLVTGNATDNINVSSVHNGKETVVILSGGFWDNGITSALLNTLENIDTTQRNYICFFGRDKVKPEHFYKLKNLPENVLFYPVPGELNGTLFQRLINSKYLWKEGFKYLGINRVLRKMYRNEYNRIFGSLKIDWFIHYTGFERKYAEMLRHIDASTAIFVHTDMFQEYEAKKNFSKKIVFGAYKKADKVVLVNKNLKKELVEKVKGIEEQVIVVNNFLGEDRVRGFAKEPLLKSLENVPVDYSYNEERLEKSEIKELIDINNLLGTHEKIFGSKIINDYLNNQEENQSQSSKVLLDYITKSLDVLEKRFEETIPNIFSPTNRFYIDFKNVQGNLESEKTFFYPNKYIFDSLRISKIRMLEFINNEDITVFMTIGRYDYQKGHDRLIGAFEKNYENNNNIALIMICPHGSLKKETLARVRNSQAKNNIIVLGRMSNPYSLLKNIDAFILSSHYEGLGLVVYEALALDTDVITVNLTETVELLQNDEALIVDNSEEGIEQGIHDYLYSGHNRNVFDFETPKKQSKIEFESIFNTKN